MEEPLKIKLHVLSPIHVGCDDVYEPIAFVIDDAKGKLLAFDPIDFAKSLSTQDRDALSKKCMADNLLDIYKFVKNKYNAVVGAREVSICKDLAEHYKNVLKLPSFNKDMVINKFTINRTAYNSHNALPYIPGTSLKGALRTGYLSSLAVDKGWREYLDERDLKDDQSAYYWIGKKKVAKKMGEDLLRGAFDTDPFRMVKVADMLPVGNISTKVIYAKNRKKTKSDKPTKAEQLTHILEVIEAGATFEGLLNIQRPSQEGVVLNPIDRSFLKSVNDFFGNELNKEQTVAKEIGAAHIDISKFNGRLGESAFIVRLGRHSGAESVTIEGNRHIKIMQKQGSLPKYLDHATTIWLASESNKPTTNSGLVPFGWAVLEVVDKLTEPAAGRETDAEHDHLNSPALERASIADVHEATVPETDPSDSLMERLLRDVARCRGAQDKHVLVRAFDEAKALPPAKRLAFLQKVGELLPVAMKANAKVKAFLKEHRQAFEADQ